MCEERFPKSISCEDIENVISLPIEIGQSEHSVNLEQYENRKRKEHEAIIERMRKEIEAENLSVEKEASQIIELAKEELKWINKEVDTNMANEMTSLEGWNYVSEINRKHRSKIASVIEEYDKNLKSLEKPRAESIMTIICKYLDEAIKLRFMSVEKIEKHFDNDIVELNKRVLYKFQTYEDLKLRFQIEGEEMLNKCEDALKKQARYIAEHQAQRLWAMIQSKQKQRLVIDTVLKLTEDNSKTREEFLNVTNNLVEKLSEVTEFLTFPEEYDVNGEHWEHWIVDLNKKLETLSALCKNVENLLKTAVSTLLESFQEKLNTLTRTFTLKYHNSQNEVEELIQELSTDVDAFKNSKGQELKYIKTMWEDIIDTLNKKIERSRSFVLDLTSIWTNHVSRVNRLHKELGTNLSDILNECIKSDKDKKSKIKVQIKAVREAKNLEKLNAQCNVLDQSFSELSKMWEDNYETRLELIDNVTLKDIDKLVESKLLDVQHFLQIKYSKRELFSENVTPHLRDCGSDIDTQINLCNTYMEAVDNRLLGMFEMVERYAPMCERSVKEECEVWLSLYSQDVIDNYESHMNELYELSNKTLQDTKQLRTAELKVHSDRLLSHSSGVKAEVTELNRIYDEVKSKQISRLDDFYGKLKTLPEIKSLSTSRLLKDIISELECEWNILAESLESHISEAKTNSDTKSELLKRSNDMFLTAPKIFKNGGNYSPEEIKQLCKELKQLEKYFNSHKVTLNNNYSKLLKEISRQALDLSLKEMQEKLDKLSLQDNIISTLDVVRTRLRSEINNMYTLGKEFTVPTTFNVLNFDIVNKICSNACLRFDYMKVPSGVLSLECSGNKGKSVISLSANAKSGKSNKKSIYKHNELFNHVMDGISTETCNYLACTKTLMLNKYNSLIKSIRGVYGVKSEPLEKGTKSSTSKKKEVKQNIETNEGAEYIDHLKTTLQAYNLECESVWSQQAREFLDHITYFRIVTNSLIKDKLKEVHQDYINNLTLLEKGYTETILNQVRQDTSNRDQIHQSLVLPLAHPTHQDKLIELYKRSTDICNTQKNNSKHLLTRYEKDLQTYHDKYVDEIKVLKMKLVDIQSIVFSNGPFDEIYQHFQAIEQTLPFHTDSKTNDEEITDITEHSIYPQSLWSDATDIDNLFKCDFHYKNSVPNSDSEISNEQAVKIPINRIAAENIKQSAEQIQKLYDKAKDLQKCNEDVIVKWLNSFEYNVKQAKLVYSSLCN